MKLAKILYWMGFIGLSEGLFAYQAYSISHTVNNMLAGFGTAVLVYIAFFFVSSFFAGRILNRSFPVGIIYTLIGGAAGIVIYVILYDLIISNYFMEWFASGSIMVLAISLLLIIVPTLRKAKEELRRQGGQ